jgi:hypothetical protein
LKQVGAFGWQDVVAATLVMAAAGYVSRRVGTMLRPTNRSGCASCQSCPHSVAAERELVQLNIPTDRSEYR